MSTPRQASKTKVLLVNTPTLPPIGADTWIHVEVIRALDRSRFDVHVACMEGPPGTPTPMYAAVSTISDIHLRTVSFGTELTGLSRRQRVVQMLKDLPGIVSSFVGLAVYVRRQRIQIIHTVTRPRDALACVVLAKLTRTKSLIHVQLAFGEWMSPSMRWAMRHADGLVAITEFVKRTLVESGHRPDRIHIAFNAIVFGDWNPVVDKTAVRSELGLPTSGPMVVTVSRLFKQKGTAELLRAIAVVRNEIPDVRVVVVGRDASGGSYVRELEGIIEAEGMQENVILVGQRSDIPRFMAAADLFAMPSIEEPFGIVFAEAMAMELPVVALNNGGTPEVVDNGSAGLLSAQGDGATLADNLLTLLSDPDLRRKMGVYGREQAKQRFTVEHLASEMAKIYEAAVR